MRLDAMARMDTAAGLCNRLGFRPIAAECDIPVAGAITRERELGGRGG